LGRSEQPVILPTVVCQYSLSASLVPTGKRKMDSSRLEG
jgi:hypothetical protein